MKIPPNITVRNIMHGSGAKGASVYISVNEEHGVYQVARRESRSHPFVETYSYAYLPGQDFKSFKELCMAAENVTPEQIEVERAKYPVVISTEAVKADRGYNNGCRLCPWVPNRRELHPEKHRVHLARDGSGHADDYVPLCDEHVKLTSDPVALVAALKAEVAARRSSSKLFNEADPS